MVGRELLEELQSAGFTVRLRPPDGIHVAPASALTDELREAIRKNKPLLVEALRRRKQQKEPVWQCGICHGTAYWERPADAGGGPVCRTCHPRPDDLVAVWERRSDEAAEPIDLEPKRAWLLAWGLAAGCPPLAVRPWMTLAGTAHGWHRFVLTASDEEIEAAARAAEGYGGEA
jgi:hypothetical protein